MERRFIAGKGKKLPPPEVNDIIPGPARLGKELDEKQNPGEGFLPFPGIFERSGLRLLFDVTARRINSTPRVNATPRAKQIRAFWIRPARMKQTKLIAATVIA